MSENWLENIIAVGNIASITLFIFIFWVSGFNAWVIPVYVIHLFLIECGCFAYNETPSERRKPRVESSKLE